VKRGHPGEQSEDNDLAAQPRTAQAAESPPGTERPAEVQRADPEREEAAIRRGDALGFVDRDAASSATGEMSGETTPRRRRRSAQPQVSVFIKGPKDTLDWFVEYTNQRGHRSYWETLEEFRALVEGK